MMTPQPAQVDRLTVTRVEYTTGMGTEDDPCRRIIELHDERGCFLQWDTLSRESHVDHIPTELSEREAREERG